MIITQKMVEYFGGCDSGLIFMRSYAHLYPNGIEFNDAVDIVSRLKKDDLVKNLISNRYLYIRASDKYTKGTFRYFCTECGEPFNCDTREEAEAYRQTKYTDFFNKEVPKFYIAQEIEHENGDTTWNTVEFSNLSEEDTYQVFNPKLGTYTIFNSISEVKAFIKSSINEYIDLCINTVEQEIFSGYGDSDWINPDDSDPIIIY